MSLAGLLTKILDEFAPEITSRGLTGYFLIDTKGGGTKKVQQQFVDQQQSAADGFRARGVIIGDVTDALTQTFDDRGVLIVWQTETWMKNQGVLNKLKTAIQIRWILSYGRQILDGDIEDFVMVREKQVIDGTDKTWVRIFKRVKVYV